MTATSLICVAALAVPLLIVFWGLLWARNRAVYWFACACLAVGLGYLIATGAAGDIGTRVQEILRGEPTPKPVR